MKLNLPKEVRFEGPAAMWKRISAFLVDVFVIDFVIGQPFGILIAKAVPGTDFGSQMKYFQNNPMIVIAVSTIMLAYGFLAMMYFAILEYKLGGSAGKLLFGIRVKEDKNCRGFFSYLVRNMFLLFIFPFMLLWVIDPVFMFINKDGRRLSEILSGTRTIDTYR